MNAIRQRIQWLIVLAASFGYAFGYVFLTEGLLAKRLIIGTMFGAGIGFSLMKYPQKFFSRTNAFLLVPLLVALVVFTAIYQPEKAIITLVWAGIYLGLFFAYIWAGRKDSEERM